MKDEGRCAGCGRALPEDAPEGLCPVCLLRDGLATAEPRPEDPENTETQALPRRAALDVGTPPAAALAHEIEGRYTTVLEAARGGMGRVWLVRDEQLGREVALKELLPDPGGSTHPTTSPSHPMGGRFAREARVTAQLQHPSITPVYELGRRPDGALYYTMKFVRGKTLSEAIAERRSFEERRRLLPHFVDLCQAIAYAHSRGVVHRDIKPGNVMIGDFGETVVVDWGLAKVGAEESPLSPAAVRPAPWSESQDGTMAGHALGTPAYMPPEQAQGRLDEVDERSDIYSLGAVLYEILTGRRPYAGESAAAVISKVIAQPPPPPRAVDKKVPEEYARICAKAMARSRADRYGSAVDLAADLENVRLRPPKGAARRAAELLLAASLLGVPLGIAVANWRSEHALRSAMERLAAKGIDVSFERPESFLPRRPSSAAPAGAPGPRATRSPVGALYALRWGFPDLADEESPLWRTLQALEPIRSVKRDVRMSSADESRARLLVAANQPLLDALSEMARLPPEEGTAVFRHAMVSAGDPFDAELPDFTALRAAALTLSYRARLASAEGRPEAALDDLARVLELSNHHAALPWLISSLRRSILAEIALDVFERMPDAWPPPADEPSDLEKALAAFSPRRELPRALEGELKSMLWAFDRVKRGSRGAIVHDIPSPGHWIGALGWSLYGSAPLRFWLNGDQSLYVGFMADYVEAARHPFHEARAELRRIDTEADRLRSWRHPIMDTALVSASGLVERAARVESRVLQARLRLALHRFQARSGGLPETLERLSTAELSELPIDPLSGLPFDYRRVGTGYSLKAPDAHAE
jgi:hypothetical protein